MNIIILAAGMGKRMQSSIPKVLHQVANKPMLHHVVETVEQLNPQRLIIVVGHEAQQVKDSFEQSDKKHNILWAYQEQQLGTGHAVLQAMHLVDNNFPTLILYGDVPLINISTLKYLINASQNKLGILTAYYDNPTGYGRIIKQNNKVQCIIEEKDANIEQKAINEINTGIICLPTVQLHTWLSKLKNHNAQAEYYLTDIAAYAVSDDIEIICTQPLQGNWETFGVNSKLHLVQIERIYQEYRANILLEQGVTLIDNKRIDIRGKLTVEQDVIIDVGCVFEGDVYLGKKVHIKAYCVIKDSHIGENSIIENFSHIDSAYIEGKAQIGPYARIRPQTKLGLGVKIGNFVEIKKSTISHYSKVNHLSYIGDATIGENVNIGAGVITCNYDGVNKHQTIIEDEAFIGSDCQLIAPVTIKEKATIAAGTTVTKNAPKEQLTIARVKQISISTWKRPIKKK